MLNSIKNNKILVDLFAKLTAIRDALKTGGFVRREELEFIGDVKDLKYPSPTIVDGINHNHDLIGNELEYLELQADSLIDEANKLLHQIGDVLDIPYESLTAAIVAIDAHDQEQDAKLQTLNGHYYPLDGYDFGKTLDVKTPNLDDVTILTTYAMTKEGVSEPADIIENTVIKNEFDGVEFVWNAETLVWTDWGIGNIVTASNEHLGVVKGNSQSGDGNISVGPDGSMKAVDYHGLWDNIIDLKNLLGDIDAALDLINGETP